MSLTQQELDDLNNAVSNYWTLDADDISGSTVTDVAGTADGTINGSPGTVSSGFINEALDFNGSTDFISTSAVGDNVDDKFTIGCRVIPTNIDGNDDELLGSFGPSSGIALQRIGNTIRLIVRDSGGGSEWAYASTTLVNNNSYFIVGTFDGSNLRIYINGVLESTTDMSSSVISHGGTIGIAKAGYSRYFQGEIDEVFVCNRDISQSEIDYLYSSGSPTLNQQYVFGVGAGPSSSTLAADNISDTSARLNGDLTDLNGESSVDVYFQYRETSSSTWIDTSPKQTLTTLTTFNESVSGLTASTEYEFRTVAEWNSGADQSFGDALTFTTLATPSETFNVNIVSVNTPIKQGQTLDVVVDVENTGSADGTQDLTLAFDTESNIVDTQSVSVNQGVTERITLSYIIPSSQTIGTYNVWVASDDDSKTSSVVVEESTVAITLIEPTQGQEYKGFTVSFKWSVDTDGETGNVYLFLNKPLDANVSEAVFFDVITTAGVYNYDETLNNVGDDPSGINNNTWFVRFVSDE